MKSVVKACSAFAVLMIFATAPVMAQSTNDKPVAKQECCQKSGDSKKNEATKCACKKECTTKDGKSTCKTGACKAHCAKPTPKK